MRLKISKFKNTILLYIIKDYTKNGKKLTKVVKRIGNIEELSYLIYARIISPSSKLETFKQ